MNTQAYRYAQAMAVTEHARGRAEEERAWLDLLALLDAPAPAPSVVRVDRWADGSTQAVYSDGSHGPWTPAAPLLNPEPMRAQVMRAVATTATRTAPKETDR